VSPRLAGTAILDSKGVGILKSIGNDQELQATLDRVRQFEHQVANLRRVERNPEHYRLSASGYLAELDRMTLEVRGYLWSHPTEAQPGLPA
jgi:hypothetical protein